MKRMQCRRRRIRHAPSEQKILDQKNRMTHMDRIYNGFSDSCVTYVRMRSGAFIKLANIMREKNLLKDSRHVTVEEQLAMTLNILGHKTKNRMIRSHFIRSGETLSRYFNKVLEAICHLRGRYMRQAPNEVPPEILNNPRYYPYFKVHHQFFMNKYILINQITWLFSIVLWFIGLYWYDRWHAYRCNASC